MDEKNIEQIENKKRITVKLIRQLYGISKTELGNKAGISPRLVQYIENGQRRLTEKTASKICNAFNLKPIVFIDEKTIIEEFKK